MVGISSTRLVTQHQELLERAEDLVQLKNHIQCPSKTRLCTDGKGHLWTEETNVGVWDRIVQFIYSLLYEKTFSSEEEKATYLAKHFKPILLEAKAHSLLNVLPSWMKLNEFCEEFNAETLRKVLEMAKKAHLTGDQTVSSTGPTGDLSNFSHHLTLLRDSLLDSLSNPSRICSNDPAKNSGESKRFVYTPPTTMAPAANSDVPQSIEPKSHFNPRNIQQSAADEPQVFYSGSAIADEDAMPSTETIVNGAAEEQQASYHVSFEVYDEVPL